MQAVWLLVLLAIGAPSGDDPKAPPPDPAALKRAEATIRSVFRDDYRAKESVVRRAFAIKLHAQALETTDDPAARFVLLRDAADIAAEVGDAKLATTAARAIAKFYDVKLAEAARSALDKLRKSTPETSSALAESCLALAEEALAAEDPDGAAGIARDAETAALKARHMPLFNKARALQKDIAETRSGVAAVGEARKKLAQSPEDPDASLVVGRHLCFLAGDWAKGLPLLAKGSDPALQALAQGDLAEPVDAPARVKIGDGWWDAAEKASGTAKAKLQKRARRWYSLALALPEVPWLVKAKLEARLQEPWGPIFDGRTLGCIKEPCRFGWKVADGAMSKVPSVNESAQTQEEFDDGEFRFRFELRNLVYVRFSIRQGEQGLDAVQFSEHALQALEGKPHDLVFKARGGDVSATLDGQPIRLTDHSAVTKGYLHVSVKGEVLRILALEYRPLP